MTLWENFLTHQGKPSFKWTHYFPIYEKHFNSWRGRNLTFLEVGVLNGGSAQLWRKYFGPQANIVCIDINPECKQHEEQGISIRIGDQSDPVFLQSVIDEFGVPDIVLDDGSHQQHHIFETFKFLYPKLGYNGIYMVEDLHCSYWPSHNGSISDPNTFMNRSKNWLDQLNTQHTDQIVPDPLLKDTFSMSFYDSIAVFEKGRPFVKNTIWSGGQ